MIGRVIVQEFGVHDQGMDRTQTYKDWIKVATDFQVPWMFWALSDHRTDEFDIWIDDPAYINAIIPGVAQAEASSTWQSWSEIWASSPSADGGDDTGGNGGSNGGVDNPVGSSGGGSTGDNGGDTGGADGNDGDAAAGDCGCQCGCSAVACGGGGGGDNDDDAGNEVIRRTVATNEVTTEVRADGTVKVMKRTTVTTTELETTIEPAQ